MTREREVKMPWKEFCRGWCKHYLTPTCFHGYGCRKVDRDNLDPKTCPALKRRPK